MNVLKRYKPKCVLDPTAGWGNRLCSCSILDIPYIGIDSNENLLEPYEKMILFFSKFSNTNTKNTFVNTDCLMVDYSQLEYDMVLTSLPYYNIEIYNNNRIYKTKKEFNENFYIPLITKTYKFLKNNGVYALNIPKEIYENSCVAVLGHCDEKIPLIKRGRNNKYTEFIYIWQKRV